MPQLVTFSELYDIVRGNDIPKELREPICIPRSLKEPVLEECRTQQEFLRKHKLYRKNIDEFIKREEKKKFALLLQRYKPDDEGSDVYKIISRIAKEFIPGFQIKDRIHPHRPRTWTAELYALFWYDVICLRKSDNLTLKDACNKLMDNKFWLSVYAKDYRTSGRKRPLLSVVINRFGQAKKTALVKSILKSSATKTNLDKPENLASLMALHAWVVSYHLGFKHSLLN